MADSLYWDGKIHKPVKFGDPFDPHTVEGRRRAAQAPPRSATSTWRDSTTSESSAWLLSFLGQSTAFRFDLHAVHLV
jgi:hypothetical protein